MQITNIIIISILTGINEIEKQFIVDKKYIPLFSLVMGIIITLLAYGVNTNNVIIGIINGLSSCGLYSGVKNTMEVINNEN
jgi:hypothetical protein